VVAVKVGINGLDVVLKNLNSAIKKLEVTGTAGLIEAGALVRAEGQKETPVDKGNLVNSWYGPTPFDTLKGPIVEIGLTASYAVYVHEMVDANFQKPGSKAKFLEDPIKALSGTLVAIIGKKMETK